MACLRPGVGKRCQGTALQRAGVSHPEDLECGDLTPLGFLGKRCGRTAFQKGSKRCRGTALQRGIARQSLDMPAWPCRSAFRRDLPGLITTGCFPSRVPTGSSGKIPWGGSAETASGATFLTGCCDPWKDPGRGGDSDGGGRNMPFPGRAGLRESTAAPVRGTLAVV